MSRDYRYREYSRLSSIPEPEELQYEIFFPISPKLMQLLLISLIIKHTSTIFLPLFLNVSNLAQLVSISMSLDILFLFLLYISSNSSLNHVQLSAIKKMSGALLLFIGISGIFVNVFLPQFPSHFNLSFLSNKIIVIIYLSELLFFLIIKEQLVKRTDKFSEIEKLAGASKSLLIAFILSFAITLGLIYVNIQPYDFYIIQYLQLMGYLVFINLWISGPNEYMDKESIHRIIDLSVLVGITLITTFSIFQLYSNLPNEIILATIFLPTLLINLLLKFRGYIFRKRKLLQVAIMDIDEKISGRQQLL